MLSVEMIMSMLLFITMTGLPRCKVPIRFGLVIMIMLYCFRNARWAAVEFLGGAIIAEIDLIQHECAYQAAGLQLASFEEADPSEDLLNPLEFTSIPSNVRPNSVNFKSRAGTVFWWIQLIFALWICGWPNRDVEEAPGLAWLAKHAPEPYLTVGEEHYMDWRAAPWYILAALQIVLSC